MLSFTLQEPSRARSIRSISKRIHTGQSQAIQVFGILIFLGVLAATSWVTIVYQAARVRALLNSNPRPEGRY